MGRETILTKKPTLRRRKSYYRNIEEHYDRSDWINRREWYKTKEINLKLTSDKPIVRRYGTKGKITSGEWTDPYTGLKHTKTKNIHVDHTVALSEAHKSGGAEWSKEKKRQYGHYLRRGHLVPIEDRVNIEKSDHDIANWVPPLNPRKYALQQEKIKHYFGLSADPKEAKKLGTILGRKTKLKVSPSVENTWYCQKCHGKGNTILGKGKNYTK